MNLKVRRLKTGKENIKIISEKKRIEIFSIKNVGRPSLVSDEMLIEIKSILSNLCVSGSSSNWK